MAEQKKGGFHALEQRIHQIEEEDAKQEQGRVRGARREAAGEPGAQPNAERQAPPSTRK